MAPSRKQIIFEAKGRSGAVFDVADTYVAPLLSLGLRPPGHSREQITLTYAEVTALADVLDRWLLTHPPGS